MKLTGRRSMSRIQYAVADAFPAQQWLVSPSYFTRIIIFLIVAIILFQGHRFWETDYPVILDMIMNGKVSSIDPSKGYLVEGLLGDLIGIFYLSAGFRPAVAQHLWAITGIICLTAVLFTRIRNGSIHPLDLILLLAFSRLIDTLSLWDGRFDSFLLAALVMSTDKNTKVALYRLPSSASSDYIHGRYFYSQWHIREQMAVLFNSGGVTVCGASRLLKKVFRVAPIRSRSELNTD